MDPALPLFINAPPSDKLDASDAEFVDVYHSNAFVQGQIERCGTVDFYMNGGIGTYRIIDKRFYTNRIKFMPFALSILQCNRVAFPLEQVSVHKHQHQHEWLLGVECFFFLNCIYHFCTFSRSVCMQSSSCCRIFHRINSK